MKRVEMEKLEREAKMAEYNKEMELRRAERENQIA